MRWMLALAFGGWLVALAAVAADAPAAPKTEPGPRNLVLQLGEEEFVRYCAACHGTEGRGDGPAAKALTRPPADLTLIAARRGGLFPDAEIASIIDGRFEVAAHGNREMPIWGRRFSRPIAEDTSGDEVARGRIELLVEYLKSIQRSGGTGGATP